MRFVIDEDGDIGFTLWNIITFLKYKDSVLIVWFKRHHNAPKYLPKCV